MNYNFVKIKLLNVVFKIMKLHSLVTVYNCSEVTYCPHLCVTSFHCLHAKSGTLIFWRSRR